MSQLHAMNQILKKHCTTQTNCLGHTLHIIQARPKARTNSFDQSFVSGRAPFLFFISFCFSLSSLPPHTPYIRSGCAKPLDSLFPIYLSSIFLTIFYHLSRLKLVFTSSLFFYSSHRKFDQITNVACVLDGAEGRALRRSRLFRYIYIKKTHVSSLVSVENATKKYI